MSKTFDIMRAIIFILIQAVVLAFITIAHGDMVTSLVVSAGVFFLSIVGALVLIQIFKRGSKQK